MSQMRVFLAGDSTMSHYDQSVAPRAGWGQMLHAFLSDEVDVVNEAASGRSSKSFIHEGRLERIAKRIRSEDYLFIQFGHNDQKDDERHTEPYGSYQSYLKQYIDLARDKGAYPVLLTSIHRRKFDSEGKIVDTHGHYLIAMRELASQCQVPLIDMAASSQALFESLGPDGTKDIFLWLEPGVHPHYTEGVQDNTHFSEHGAKEMARLAVMDLVTLSFPLAQNVVKDALLRR
ncbi:rhamnogalacturonan acetylesterase [Caldalkalibacillus salinus]|uniref:rhamnogalacturonan acetylesterase n=1 Tax=Caldalkalibacillus salinus TaxID=2803787 RepID=UPI001920921F|nr:rhamnogalacturonan acetylesterase [Caldalkalibacillus salinus]